MIDQQGMNLMKGGQKTNNIMSKVLELQIKQLAT
jgi:hypothetical protein